MRQQTLGLQRDAQEARGVESRPSGLEGPMFSFLFEVLYLQLRYFRKYQVLLNIKESSSDDAPTVRSEFLGRRAIEQLVRGDTVPVLDIVQRHHGHVSLYSGDTTDERDVLDILERSGITYIVQNALLQRGMKDPSVYFGGYVEGTRAVIEATIAAGVLPYLEKPFDAYNLLPYRSTTPSKPNLEQRSRTQCIRSDVDSDAEPERSFLSFVFMTIYSRIYRSKVLDQVEAQSLIFKGKEDDAELQAECEDPMMKDDSRYIAKTRLDYGNISRLASNEVMIGPRGAESVEVSGVLRATALEENYEAKVPFLVLIRTLSTAKYRYPSAKEEAIDSDGQLEAVRRLLPPRLRPPDGEMEGQQSTLSEVSACTCQGRRPIFEAGSKIYRSKVTCFVMIRACTTLQYSVPRVEKVVNRDGRLEVARRHLVRELRPPDGVPDEVREIKCAHAQGVEAVKIGMGQVNEARVPVSVSIYSFL
ncbi:hypothetical protein M404DRAFT_378733 [Pisolithus tinctorius Marx 270]|uniref:3-beta hydroxysteroid dehydrogenase/isomerase domain-containing protein n=1 Tax=Pisolithus tinctorius Marx 270 TaxID=870435 RepID=A0A0C3KEP2_PISTI|nr:hypothetical protein M404DRAFT_378733 [Pisolithus tinctorius Marx 270]